MSLVVNTNVAALNSLNHLSKTQKTLSGNLSRISSGLRITSAADDAAGLAVAENLDSDHRSLMQAGRNINDGISIIQTAEGATNEVANILKRMRELATQSSSETLASSERVYVQDEYLQLHSEVNRIASVTEFNGVALTDGSDTALDVQAGIFNTPDDRVSIALGDLRTSTLGLSGLVTLSSVSGAQSALDTFDNALTSVNSYRSTLGSIQNRLDSSLRNIETYAENLKSAESHIRDADFAYETAQMTKNQIMQQAGVAILGQANQLGQGALRLLQ